MVRDVGLHNFNGRITAALDGSLKSGSCQTCTTTRSAAHNLQDQSPGIRAASVCVVSELGSALQSCQVAVRVQVCQGRSGRQAVVAMGTGSQATNSSDTTSGDETSSAESSGSSSSSSESDGARAADGSEVARAADGAPTRAETWLEHVKNHGPNHHCARCVWAKEREKCETVLVYQDKAGGTGSWVEEVCSTDTLWALRCKVCHWAGENRTKLGRGEARAFTETSLDTLRRHGNNRHSQARAGQRCTAHDRALLSLRQEGSAGQDDEAHVGGASCFVEMPDAPSWSHIAHVWNTC